jgi:transposase InsO family protein
VEVWTATGLKRYAVLFVIELATRRVQIAGIASEPDSACVVQCGRQLTDAVDGFQVGKRFPLHDRDPLFSDAFRETLAATGVETVRLLPRAPNLNAHAERYVRTIKEACVNRMIFVGERSLRRAITEFVTHYHHERHHQGLGNVLIFPAGGQPRRYDRVVCRERLGGPVKYYHRPAT